MAAMDLRTNSEVMGMQDRYSNEFGSRMFEGKETFEEDDFKGNNNIFNSLKTEANSKHSSDPSSLFQVKCSNKKNLEVDNSVFSYSSFKKAMDLRTHNRTLDGGRRTIFEDADYFAKNHCYKLLPITFEQVDETIIQSEHNYSLFSLTSESEPEEDCSRLMDYSQVKEKNYKRRRTKFREGSEKDELLECGTPGDDENYAAHCSSTLPDEDEVRRLSVPRDLETEAVAIQPLDLSSAPLADDKTDPSPRELPDDEKNDDVARLDSDKENVDLELNGIRVTITRPDEKENYQPCDLFLNDIARLVPWLIDKDCFEVDILDRTCDGHDEFRKHRLYYVISESTWRLFQTSNERVILTNDRSLGQPLRKAEKDERPSFLVFDQFSLAKCLAEYCQDIGGCFEYTCVEEGKGADEVKSEEEGTKKAESAGEVAERIGKTVEEFAEAVGEGKEITKAIEVKPKETEGFEELPRSEELQKGAETLKDESKEAVKEDGRVAEIEEVSKKTGIERAERGVSSSDKEVIKMAGMQSRVTEQASVPKTNDNNDGEKKEEKKQAKGTKSKRKSPVQAEVKNSRVTTRSKSTSESETSQKSDERVNRKEGGKRGGSTLPKAQPPIKLRKSTSSEGLPRRTRSGRVLEEVKANKVSSARKESAGLTGARKRPSQGVAAKPTTRSLRSQKGVQRKGEEKGSGKGKGRGWTPKTKVGKR